MININFFNYTGDNNTVNKELKLPTKIVGRFVSDIEVVRPYLTIRNQDISKFNYCYIEELNRYYFIESFTIIDNSDIRVYLYLDVLKTYENIILNAVGTVVESSNADKYISTRTNIYDSRPKFEIREFQKDFFTEDGDIIMITIKGSEQ